MVGGAGRSSRGRQESGHARSDFALPEVVRFWYMIQRPPAPTEAEEEEEEEEEEGRVGTGLTDVDRTSKLDFKAQGLAGSHHLDRSGGPDSCSDGCVSSGELAEAKERDDDDHQEEEEEEDAILYCGPFSLDTRVFGRGLRICVLAEATSREAGVRKSDIVEVFIPSTATAEATTRGLAASLAMLLDEEGGEEAEEEEELLLEAAPSKGVGVQSHDGHPDFGVL